MSQSPLHIQAALRARSRSSESTELELRCPWCFEGGQERAWLTCPRDATPAHSDCLREFGGCPICRLPVEAEPAAPATRAALRLELPGRIAALPDEVQAALAAAARDYRHPFQRTWLLVGLALVGALGGLGVASLGAPWLGAALLCGAPALALGLRALPARPRADALVPAGVDPRRARLAAELARDDAAALARARAHARAREGARLLARRLDELARERLEDYRRALGEGTPIEDAQRVRGIGPKTAAALRAAGITSLAVLAQRDPGRVRGVGPARASLLSSWARARRGAIERLVAAGAFPVDPELERAHSARVERPEAQLRAARAEAESCAAALSEWAAGRGERRARLTPRA